MCNRASMASQKYHCYGASEISLFFFLFNRVIREYLRGNISINISRIKTNVETIVNA